MQQTPSTQTMNRYRQITVIVVIALGYLVAFADLLAEPQFPLSPLEVAIVLLAGVVFTYLDLREGSLIGTGAPLIRVLAYFALQILLFAVIVLTIGVVNGAWLLAMPLVGSAVGHFFIPGGLVVGAITLSIIAVPAGLAYGWETAVSLATGVVPAMVFVGLFVMLLVREERARNRAEKLAADLEAANRQLAAYAAQAEELAISKERNRLAREIHDSLGHYLTVINVQLEAARVIMDQDPERAREALSTAKNMAHEGLASVRQSVAALRESPLQGRPLDEVIARLLEETGRAGIVTSLTVEGERRPLGANNDLTLYRIAQEGLTNVRKHARASRVDVILDYQQPGQVRLTINDNGVGATLNENSGFGLLGVRERLELVGGRLDIDTAPGKGFHMVAALPG
jgi:signal transduction histidine kinase